MPAPAPQFYDATGTNPVSALVSSDIAAGSTHGPTGYQLWNDKGGALGSDPITNAYLRVELYDGTRWKTSGEPALDEAWFQVSLTGIVSTGDPTMEAQTTAFIPLGANRHLPLKNIPSDCARTLSLQIVVPAGAQNLSQEVRLVVVFSETSRTLASSVALGTGGGVIPARQDQSNAVLTHGFAITASGTDAVTVANGLFAQLGQQFAVFTASLTLNQNDVAAAALGIGESYIAAISTTAAGSATHTVTKGAKAVSPTTPALPSSAHILIGYVTVHYQGGGTSIIVTDDVDQTAARWDEFHFRDGGGLNLTISPGRAITASDTEISHTVPTTLALPDESSLAVWLLPDGTFTTSSGTRPVTGAVKVGSCATAAGAITSMSSGANLTITPFAEFVGLALTQFALQLKYSGPLEVVDTADWCVVPIDAILVAVDCRVRTAGSGAGTVELDVVNLLTATSIYSAGGTGQKPSFSATQKVASNLHFPDKLAYGATSTLGLSITAATMVTPPVDLIVTLLFVRKTERP